MHCIAPFDSGSPLIGLRLQRRRLYGGIGPGESDSGSEGNPGLWQLRKGVPAPIGEASVPSPAGGTVQGTDSLSPDDDSAEVRRRRARKTLFRCEGYRIAALRAAERGDQLPPGSSNASAEPAERGVDGVWGGWRDAAPEIDPQAAAALAQGTHDGTSIIMASKFGTQGQGFGAASTTLLGRIRLSPSDRHIQGSADAVSHEAVEAGTLLSWPVSKLSPGARYQFRVVARNAVGWGQVSLPSGLVRTRGLPPPRPLAPLVVPLAWAIEVLGRAAVLQAEHLLRVSTNSSLVESQGAASTHETKLRAAWQAFSQERLLGLFGTAHDVP